MEENLQRQLYKELDRLQNVIDVLLEQNAQLKKAVHHYEQQLQDMNKPFQPATLQPMHEVSASLSSCITTSDGQKTVHSSTLYSNDGGMNGSNPVLASRDGGTNGEYLISFMQGGRNNNTFNALDNERMVEKENQSFILAKQDGGKNVSHPMPLQQGGVLKSFKPIFATEENREIKNVYLHESRSALITYRQGDGASPTATTTAPQPATGLPASQNGVTAPQEKKVNLPTAMLKVRTVMPTSHDIGLENTVLILLHLQKAPDAPMKVLRKVTGLSETGIEKRIMAMKKAGLIIRPLGRRLLYLTPRAKQMLEDAKM